MVSRKRVVLGISLSLLLLLSALGVGCAPAPEEGTAEPGEVGKVIKWNMNLWCSSKTFVSPESALACERISQRLDGRFVITPVYGQSLGVTGFETLAAVSEGVFPIACSPTSYLESDMPVLGVLGLCGLYGNLWEHDLVSAYLTEPFGEEFEKQGVKLIGGMAHYPPSVLISKVPIREIEDFKGLTIRGYSAQIAAVIDALGGNPITMPMAEVYLAAERGLLDSYISSVTGAKSISIWEIWDYATDICFVPSDTAIIVNNDAFEKLPAEYKLVLVEEFTAENIRLRYRAIQTIEELWAEMVAEGMTRITPSPEMVTGIAKVAKPLWSTWAEERGELTVKTLADVQEFLEGIRGIK